MVSGEAVLRGRYWDLGGIERVVLGGVVLRGRY